MARLTAQHARPHSSRFNDLAYRTPIRVAAEVKAQLPMSPDANDLLSGLQDLATGLRGHEFQNVDEGNLRGHAGSKIFEDDVLKQASAMYPGRTYRHYEFLNSVLKSNVDKKGAAREELFGPDPLRYLLTVGKRKPLKDWRRLPKGKQVTEGQQDTADIVIASSQNLIEPLVLPVALIDLKVSDQETDGRPPNIISIEKLTQMAMRMGETRSFTCLELYYLGLEYSRDQTRRTATIQEARTIDIFKENPEEKQFVFNWTANQIQFHVSECNQNFGESRETWCRLFLQQYGKTGDAAMRKKLKVLEKRRKLIEKLYPAEGR